MKKTDLFFFVFLLMITPVFGQESGNTDKPVRSVVSATMFDIGSSKVYDTYLSPLRYSGLQVGISNERIRISKYGNGKLTAQQWVSVDFSTSHNAEQNGKYFSGYVDYTYGYFYNLKPIGKLRLLAGAQAEGTAGFIYSTKNSNNPANAKLDLGLNLSGMAIYTQPLFSIPVTFRYQMSLPFAGVFFSPAYGQSYYEIFELGNTDGILHFGSFHNRFNMQNLFTADIPLGAIRLRLGYRNKIRTFHVNSLRTQVYSHSFVIGFSSEYIPYNRKNKAKMNLRVVNALY